MSLPATNESPSNQTDSQKPMSLLATMENPCELVIGHLNPLPLSLGIVNEMLHQDHISQGSLDTANLLKVRLKVILDFRGVWFLVSDIWHEATIVD